MRDPNFENYTYGSDMSQTSEVSGGSEPKLDCTVRELGLLVFQAQ